MIDWEIILEKTILIREFEKVIQSLYFSDCIQSPVHLSIGQELTSVLISEFYKDNFYFLKWIRTLIHLTFITITIITTN